ncbi:MAG: helix-turn-helix domain-containing protein [Nocardioidaceae bacterium]
MPSIGDTLREARMRQRLDIADLESRTKIRAKYLRALENEEFGQLPGSTFVKTFLRTYAEALGLDPHRLVEQYRAEYERHDLEALRPLGPPAALGRERERRRRPRPPGRGLALAVAIVVILGLLAVLGLWGNENNDGGGTTATERAATPRAGARRTRRPRPTAVALTLAPTVPTYACVDNGPGTPVVYEGILSAARSWRARRLRVNLGKTAVQVTVNGRRFPLGAGAEPVGFDFTPTNSRPLPLGQRPCA